MISSELSRIVNSARKMSPEITKAVTSSPERLLPHRGSMLFIDEVNGVSNDMRALRATRHIAKEDPVFSGHFPDAPVYPGAFLVETIAQAGACLVCLNKFGDDASPLDAKVRALKIHYAEMTSEVAPGDTVTIDVFLENSVSLTATLSGRITILDKVCATAVVTIYVE